MYPKVLELKDTKLLLDQLERDPDEQAFVQLKGFAFQSSLAVGDVSVSSNAGTHTVMIKLAPVRRGKDGTFDLRIPVSSQSDGVFMARWLLQVDQNAGPAKLFTFLQITK